MTPEQLRIVENQIRGFLVEMEMTWLLEEIDEAIEYGVPEEKLLRRQRARSRQQQLGISNLEAEYELVARSAVDTSTYEALRKQGQLVIATRAMTPIERVQLMLDALKRVVLEVPAIETETLKGLQSVPDGDAGDRVLIDGVRFISESESGREMQLGIERDRTGSGERHLREFFLLADREVQE